MDPGLKRLLLPVYADAHVEFLRWSKARFDQYPDHVVRFPLASAPE